MNQYPPVDIEWEEFHVWNSCRYYINIGCCHTHYELLYNYLNGTQS